MATSRSTTSGTPSTSTGTPTNTSTTTPNSGSNSLNGEAGTGGEIQTNTETQLVSKQAKAQEGRKADKGDEQVEEFETHGVAPRGKMTVEQIVSYMATKPDTAEAYADLLKRNKVENPRATEIELKRQGIFIG
jgi:hypothetical protein